MELTVAENDHPISSTLILARRSTTHVPNLTKNSPPEFRPLIGRLDHEGTKFSAPIAAPARISCISKRQESSASSTTTVNENEGDEIHVFCTLCSKWYETSCWTGTFSSRFGICPKCRYLDLEIHSTSLIGEPSNDAEEPSVEVEFGSEMCTHHYLRDLEMLLMDEDGEASDDAEEMSLEFLFE